MSVSFSKRVIFNLGFDTKGRNSDVASVLKLLSPEGKTILDAGSGENGLANFIKWADIIGTDITPSVPQNNGHKFLCADITSLPFADNSFPIAASVDVLEHLPVSIRDKAIAELIRVAQKALVLAFPFGQLAREVDENFQKDLIKSKKSSPEWLDEHLLNPYPSIEDILSIINSGSSKYGKKINKVEMFYSEDIKITRSLRWAAAKSKFLFIALNSLFGLLLPVIPKPNKNNSYRAIILIQFQKTS